MTSVFEVMIGSHPTQYWSNLLVIVHEAEQEGDVSRAYETSRKIHSTLVLPSVSMAEMYPYNVVENGSPVTCNVSRVFTFLPVSCSFSNFFSRVGDFVSSLLDDMYSTLAWFLVSCPNF